MTALTICKHCSPGEWGRIDSRPAPCRCEMCQRLQDAVEQALVDDDASITVVPKKERSAIERIAEDIKEGKIKYSAFSQ